METTTIDVQDVEDSFNATTEIIGDDLEGVTEPFNYKTVINSNTNMVLSNETNYPSDEYKESFDDNATTISSSLENTEINNIKKSKDKTLSTDIIDMFQMDTVTAPSNYQSAEFIETFDNDTETDSNMLEVDNIIGSNDKISSTDNNDDINTSAKIDFNNKNNNFETATSMTSNEIKLTTENGEDNNLNNQITTPYSINNYLEVVTEVNDGMDIALTTVDGFVKNSTLETIG